MNILACSFYLPTISRISFSPFPLPLFGSSDPLDCCLHFTFCCFSALHFTASLLNFPLRTILHRKESARELSGLWGSEEFICCPLYLPVMHLTCSCSSLPPYPCPKLWTLYKNLMKVHGLITTTHHFAGTSLRMDSKLRISAVIQNCLLLLALA